MAASFAPFRPKVRYFWDGTYFYEESDGIPDRSRMPDLMVGITSWQQQVPLPTSYFASTINSTNDNGSLGYGQPNCWRIPLVPVPAVTPIPISGGNFQRGAIALAADGVPIFNPANNTGRISYEIGELDAYGGHCGLGDDYHYHIAPVHLIPILGAARPIAWALDGYPMYGYVEPDGSAMQALDSDGGHNHGGWGYHYHARGTFNATTGHWIPSAPYMNAAFHGTVVNYGGQVDPQPTASGLRASGTGGYTAQPVAGARITSFKNPVALTSDGSGHLVENVGGVPSEDQWLMRYSLGGSSYDLCWRLNRSASPRTLTMTWRLPGATTTTTYNNSGNRITAYAPTVAPSMAKVPDSGQTLNTTATFGEDADYPGNTQSFTDNGNGTITDNVTGLMWQKVDNGESTWESAVANAANATTGGYTDWRLPTPSELFSIFNHNNGNPALNTAYFPSNSSGAAGYWWTSDLYGTSTTNVWCANAGGGLGPKPKTETISAGGTLRYHARYVRGARPYSSHNYANNNDGTITDLDTGLMWTQVPGPAVAWEGAISYAENLTLAGYTDWRLPNVKELQTLTDYRLTTATSTNGIKPSLNRLLFPAATATAHWSSTTVKGATTSEAWLVEFGLSVASAPPRNAQGIISYEAKTAAHPVFAVRDVVQAPAIITQPNASQTVTEGSSVTLEVVANGEPPLSYQWFKDGTSIPGATSSRFTITSAQPANAGSYTVQISNSGGALMSSTAVVTLGTSRLVNLSVRSTAGAGDQTLIIGFVIAGAGSKTLLLRGLGPTLVAHGVTNAVSDPSLHLFDSAGTEVAANDDWGGSAAMTEIFSTVGAVALPGNSKDAALHQVIPSGLHSFHVVANASYTGIALAELYDADTLEGAAKIVNLSARTQVGTGENILIAGFVIAGSAQRTILIRGLGPTLTSYGVTGVLADPQLLLFQGGTFIAQNDNWGGGVALKSAFATVGAGDLSADASKDSALLVTLPPGLYTAHVSGVGETSGVALVELFTVP